MVSALTLLAVIKNTAQVSKKIEYPVLIANVSFIPVSAVLKIDYCLKTVSVLNCQYSIDA
jgi:hypothetical protein